MAIEKKIFSSILSLVLVTGLLPCPAFADTINAGNETKTKDPSDQNSEFYDDGIASKPDLSETDVDDKTAGNTDGYEDSDIAAMDDGEYDTDAEFSEPDYSDGKLAIWADGLDGSTDITDIYPPDTNEIELYSNGSSVSPMTFSDEMLYFCKYESSCNYDQGLSSGDGYHAMGYFQFDNRYGLGSFLKAVYQYNPSKYKALKVIGDRYGWDVTGATRSNNTFTRLGNDLNTAWHAAYKADPDEFSRLQNGWAYTEYYSGSLGARGCLGAFGINLDNRPDCIKGLCWGMVNLFGAGGGASYIKNGNYYGANWFFKYSGINESMSDETLIVTLCDFVVNNVSKRYPKQQIYWKGWQNRYRSEKEDCLSYLNVDRWINSGGQWWYRHADGSYTRNDWECINGYWYYFDSSGWMQTGWLNLDNSRYWLNGSGAMATGWQKIGGSWYYFNGSGVMQTGWLKLSNSTYYLNGSGAMFTGWQLINGNWYYMNGSGAMLTGWQWIGNDWYYLYNNGVMKTGWLELGETKYYLDGSGALRTGWFKVDSKWYYANDSGSMQAGWLKTGNTWYYLNGSGVMLAGWQWVGSAWYYLNGSGAMATGWLKLGTTWYYLNGSGAMLTGWQSIGGKWYYLDGSGAMKTGWYRVGSNWYYSNPSGVMRYSTWIGDYYLLGDGRMATNRWVGGYYVGADGKWVR